MERLESASQVLDTLGGNTAVAKITGSTSKAVWNWRAANSFPANTYVAITAALLAVGKTAPPELWDMKMPEAATQPEQVAS